MRENLSEKEYIDLVVSPIADEVQKVETARELEAHIDERTAYYEALGLSEEAARQKAVADMGDPEPVGAKLARLHPKGGIFKKIFYTLLLAVLLLIFWWWEIFSAIDDGIKGIGIIETVLLVYFLALSRAGRRQKSLYLCLLSTIVFALTGFFIFFSNPMCIPIRMVLPYFHQWLLIFSACLQGILTACGWWGSVV